jgi:hypothetical protein
VQWQPLHLAANRRHAAGVHGAQAPQQRHRSINCGPCRRFKPLDGLGSSSPRKNVEERTGEVDASDFRLTMRTKTIALIPETPDLPRFDSPGATGSLIGRVLRNALELEAVDPPDASRTAPPSRDRHR